MLMASIFQLKDLYWWGGLKKRRPNHLMPTGNESHWQRPRKMAELEKMEKDCVSK
jgi:hypothetical protein